VRRRLATALALTLLWAPMWMIVTTRTRTETVETSWARENYYYNYANYQRMGSGPELFGQHRHSTHTNPERIRILVMGDSYTYGYGTADLDLRWAERLELELDIRTRPGTFEIVTLAKGGATTADQAGWLEETDIEYDILVLGYVWNDVLPGRIERLDADHCPDRIPVPETEDPIPFTLGQPTGFACTLERLQGGMLEDVPVALREGDPRRERFLDALTRIDRHAAGRPVVAVPLLTRLIERTTQQPVIDLLAAAGFTVAPNPATKDVLTSNMPVALKVNPGDPHPGSTLTRAYANDAATTILTTIDPDRLQRATASATPARSTLISNHLPHTMTLTTETDDTAVTVTHTGNTPGSAPLYVENGTTPPPQYTPCLEIGRPHARIMLTPRLRTGTPIDITLTETDTRALELWTVGYAIDDMPTRTNLGAIRPGETRTITVGPATRGILLADPDATCSTDRTIGMPAFTVRIEQP